MFRCETFGDIVQPHSTEYAVKCEYSSGGLLLSTLNRRIVIQDSFATSHAPLAHYKACNSILDATWHPAPDAGHALYGAFCVAVHSQPVKLMMAIGGQTPSLLGSYVCKTQMDVLRAPVSVAFSLSGNSLLCGENKQIAVFDVERGGVDGVLETWKAFSGLTSCFAMSDGIDGVFAGSYSGEFGLFDYKSGVCGMRMVHEQCAGVTCLVVHESGRYCFSGARKCDSIKTWDLRMQRELRAIPRKCATQQRMRFDVMSDFLVCGDSDGALRAYDLRRDVAEPLALASAPASIGCVAIRADCMQLAVCVGERQFADDEQPLKLFAAAPARWQVHAQRLARVVGIAGPSGSGKSSCARAVVDHYLELGFAAATISTDQFFIHTQNMPGMRDAATPENTQKKLLWESPDNIDWRKLQEQLVQLRKTHDIVLVEGYLILADAAPIGLFESLDTSIMLMADQATCLARRINRSQTKRPMSAPQLAIYQQNFLAFVWPQFQWQHRQLLQNNDEHNQCKRRCGTHFFDTSKWSANETAAAVLNTIESLPALR